MKIAKSGTASSSFASGYGATDGMTPDDINEDWNRTAENWCKKEANDRASAAYIANRANGSEEDSPARPFPCDGEIVAFSKSERYVTHCFATYTQGPSDRLWMEERDCNYLARLLKTGLEKYPAPDVSKIIDTLYNLNDIPHLKDSIPKVYEILTPLLMHREELIRKKTAKTLRNLGYTTPIDDILKQGDIQENLSKIADPQCKRKVRLGAAKTLRRLGYAGPIDILGELRRSDIRDQLSIIQYPGSKPAAIIAGIKQLVELKAIEASDDLLLLFEHKDESIRLEAAAALKQLNYSSPTDDNMKTAKSGTNTSYRSGLLGATDGMTSDDINEEWNRGVNCCKKKANDGASAAYIANRANGSEEDSPARPFPCDGKIVAFSRSEEYGECYFATYAQGPSDRLWMEERDCNYLARLLKTGLEKYPAPDVSKIIDTLYNLNDIPHLKDSIPKVYEILTPLLMHREELIRKKTAKTLRNLGYTTPIDDILKQGDIQENLSKIADPQYEREVRLEAAETLRRLGYAGPIDILGEPRRSDIRDQLSLIQYPGSKPVAIIAGIKQLVELKAVEAFDDLLPLLEHKDKSIRLKAAAALKQLNYSGPVDPLDKLRQSDIRERQSDIRDQLTIIQHPAASTPRAIRVAIMQLIELKAVEAFDDLLPLLEHKDKSIRLKAAAALKQLNYSGPVDPLDKLRQSDIRERQSDIRDQLTIIQRPASTPGAIRVAIMQLVDLKAVEAFDDLLTLLEHKDKSIRLEAAAALKQLNYSGPVDIELKTALGLLKSDQTLITDDDCRIAIQKLREAKYPEAVSAISSCIDRSLEYYRYARSCCCFWKVPRYINTVNMAIMTAREAIVHIQDKASSSVNLTLVPVKMGENTKPLSLS